MANKKFDSTDNSPVNVAVIVPGVGDELEWVTVNKQLFNPSCLTEQAVDAVYEKEGAEVTLCSLEGNVLSLKSFNKLAMELCLNGKELKDGDAIPSYGVFEIKLAPTYWDMWEEGTMPRNLKIKKVIIPFLKVVLDCVWNYNGAAWHQDQKGRYYVRYHRKRWYPEDLGDALPQMEREDVSYEVREQAEVEVFVNSVSCPVSA